MSKVDPKSLSKAIRDALARDVLQMFAEHGLNEEGSLLLKGLLTESEMVMLARRLQIARALLCGDSFHTIAAKLNVGLTTIRCVHEWLEQLFDDYRSILSAFDMPLNDQAIRSLRHRYPAHHVLLVRLLQGKADQAKKLVDSMM